jgi:hypothetical protein
MAADEKSAAPAAAKRPKFITVPTATEPGQHWSGVPGVYGPGVLVPIAVTGLSEEEWDARIKAEKLPHRVVEGTKGGEA